MKLPCKQQQLSGWGNYPAENSHLYRPEKQGETLEILKNNINLIARGQGRSYGDASLNKDCVVLTQRLDKFISFNKENGVITVQAGVTFAEILDVCLPQGWIIPVIPGTKYVSAAGAFACNVHGKNHCKEGDFASHVLNVKIILANNDEIECSTHENADIFWAKAGGMGLTGFIKEISLQLKKIESLSLLTKSKKTDNISEMLECFAEEKGTADYMIGWIDHFAKGENLGRGVFESAVHADVQTGTNLQEYKISSRGITIPKFFPSFILNKYSMALYNRYRFRKYSYIWQENIVDFDGFFHPLDRLQHWNRMYGKGGFFQYQFVLPESEKMQSQLEEVLGFIQKSKQFSFLAVIKYHGDHKGMLSFPVRGYSVALDFPNNARVRKLQHELNEKIAACGGRVYLAKDALLTPDLFTKMYGDALPKWQEIASKLDPDNKFTSLMASRLHLKGAADDR